MRLGPLTHRSAAERNRTQGSGTPSDRGPWRRLKLLTRACFYLCVLFAAAALYRSDYLYLPEVVSPFAAATALLCLFVGFFASALGWRSVLAAGGAPVPFVVCLASCGLSLVGKYIPGKVWMVAGRAIYVAERARRGLGQTSLLSLQAQLLDIWAGLSLGIVGLCRVGGFAVWGWPLVGLYAMMSAAVFSAAIQRCVTGVVARFTGLRAQPLVMDFYTARTVLPWVVVTWLAWATGFQMLCVALLGDSVSWNAGLGFPLAGVLGVLTVVSPGGMGVREGILAGYLILAGMNMADASTVAVAARMWFLVGEVGMFGIGLVASYWRRPGSGRAAAQDDGVNEADACCRRCDIGREA